MNYHEKTRDELLATILGLEQENRALKLSLEQLSTLSESSDIKEPKKQMDFRISNEHFELIFNTSPDAALITRLSDSYAIEVNDGFTKLTGFTREEAIGSTVISLHLWKNPEDRKSVVDDLLKNGYCENLEAEFVRKDGSSFNSLISARTLTLGGIPHIFSRVHDISARKHAEAALKQSEEKFRSLYSNMIDGSALHTLIYDEKGIPVDYLINEVNPAFESLLGISRESVINKASKIAYNVDEPPFFEIYSRVAVTGTAEVFESYFAPLDKYFSISVYCPGKGSFATIFEDITERKKAEQSLRVILTKYQVLFDIFPIGITITDGTGKIIESNRIAEKLLGLSSEEQEKRKIGDDEWRIIRPDGSSMPAFEFASVRALEEGKQVTNVEMGIVKENNQITWINVSASPMPVEGYGVAIVYTDITERKQAESENERTKKLLEDSQRIGKIGGWEVDIDTQELKWTKEMYAIHEVDFTFKPVVDERVNFYTPESLPFIDKAIKNAIEKGEPYEIDSEIITAKGNRRSVRSMGKPDLEHRRIFGLFQDITERKQDEAELKIKNEQLKELNATKDKFFAIIAHDLKSPFNGILGFSEILKDEARDLDIDSIVAYTEIIYSTAKQTLKLLENLLDWAGMQRGGFHFEPKKTVVNNLIEDEISGLRYYADQKNISLIFDPGEEIIIPADEKMLSTVLRNLISNAIKFTPRQGRINIRSTMNLDNLIVSITDTGVGIETENIAKLFKIETSFTSRGTENEKGTGLGLLLCKEFIDKHGGKIWVDSEKGKGSTFSFSIPA